MPHRLAALSLIAAAVAVPLGAQQLGELGDGLNGQSRRRSEPVHTVAARKREPNNQSHCSFQH
jgi:hypothetical protein